MSIQAPFPLAYSRSSLVILNPCRGGIIKQKQGVHLWWGKYPWPPNVQNSRCGVHVLFVFSCNWNITSQYTNIQSNCELLKLIFSEWLSFYISFLYTVQLTIAGRNAPFYKSTCLVSSKTAGALHGKMCEMTVPSWVTLVYDFKSDCDAENAGLFHSCLWLFYLFDVILESGFIDPWLTHSETCNGITRARPILTPSNFCKESWDCKTSHSTLSVHPVRSAWLTLFRVALFVFIE